MALTCTGVVVAHIFFQLDRLDMDDLRIVAAVASWALIFKSYDWLRLFSDTAFFAELLFRSIKDMQYFIGMLVIAILAFGCPQHLLSFNTTSDEKDIHVFIESFW